MAVSYGSLPFAEQIKFFLDKLNLPAADYATVYGEQHSKAFSVAGIINADLLLDMRDAANEFIETGQTLEQFREQFVKLASRYGWAYKGEPGWRSAVIYDTNLRQSYNAGREQQMADPTLRQRRPYGLYRHSGKEKFRPEHKAWDGLVLPLDDPWWDTHSPSNGYFCGCKKYMINARDAQRLGLPIKKTAPPMEWETRTIGVTGPNPRTVRVPKGIDPGFEFNPAGSELLAQLRDELDKKLRELGVR